MDAMIVLLITSFLYVSQPITNTNLFPELNQRLGVAVDYSYTKDNIDDFPWEQFGINLWSYNWKSNVNPSNKTTQYQMIWSTQVTEKKLENIKKALIAVPQAKWLVGNEPDGIGQSKRTPQEYAHEYHTWYTLIKTYNSNNLVYFGGISQPSPNRLRWLNEMIDYYEDNYGNFPFDGIHIHNYVIPEEGSSGLGSSVGVTTDGELYGQSYWNYHADLNVFYAQLIEFRKWMKQRGYENKPLIISEYGILLSEEHGYTPDYIASYLFHTLQIILLSYDCDLGNPQDDYRIVQEVSWFSANYVPHSNSMLFDENKNLTEVGKAFHRFIKDFLNDTR